MSSKITVSIDHNFWNMLQILFIGLKLTDHINWEWKLVLIPLFAKWAIVVLGFMFFIYKKSIGIKNGTF